MAVQFIPLSVTNFCKHFHRNALQLNVFFLISKSITPVVLSVTRKSHISVKSVPYGYHRKILRS